MLKSGFPTAKFTELGDTGFMSEIDYGLAVVVIVTFLLSCLMLKGTGKEPRQPSQAAQVFDTVLNFFRSRFSVPDYSQQEE